MTYELAKQLKDAGFPYTEYHHEAQMFVVGEEQVFIPTLSELIDAMPARAKYLGTVNDAHFVLRKLVAAEPPYKAYYEDEDTDTAIPGYIFIAPTPEEAVANLWLALNAAHPRPNGDRS